MNWSDELDEMNDALVADFGEFDEDGATEAQYTPENSHTSVAVAGIISDGSGRENLSPGVTMVFTTGRSQFSSYPTTGGTVAIKGTDYVVVGVEADAGRMVSLLLRKDL